MLSDVWAYSNPWLVSGLLRWTLEGYTETRKKQKRDDSLAFPLALASLVLLATPDGRNLLPSNANGRLTSLMAGNRGAVLRAALPRAMASWVEPFWAGVAVGVGSTVLDYQNGNLRLGLSRLRPPDGVSAELIRPAHVLGRIMGKEANNGAIGAALGLRLGGIDVLAD